MINVLTVIFPFSLLFFFFMQDQQQEAGEPEDLAEG